MNKKIISLLSSAAILCSGISPVLADDTDNSIEIVYNGEYMTYDDAFPELINDRTMLPFRKILETMGAVVTYEDETGMAKAVRGDTTVEFNVNGTTVTTTKDGNVSTMEMDVAPVLKNDRTLVPVRFMSEALSMSVGWDGETQTVYIVDYEKYIDDIADTAPNFHKLFSLTDDIPGQYTSEMNTSVKSTVTTKNSGEESQTKTLNLEASNAGGKNNNYMVFNFDASADASGFADKLAQINPSGAVDFNDIQFTSVCDGETLYFKTNLVELISEQNSSMKWLAAAMLADKDTWLRIKLSDVADGSYGKNEAAIKLLTDALGSDDNNATITGITISRNGDVTAEQAMAVDAIFDSFSVCDQYLSVTQTADKTASYSFTIDKDAGQDVFNAMKTILSVDNIASMEYEDISELDVRLSGNIENGFNVSSDMYIKAVSDSSARSSDEYTKADIELSVSTKSDASSAVSVPEYNSFAYNLLTLLDSADMI